MPDPRDHPRTGTPAPALTMDLRLDLPTVHPGGERRHLLVELLAPVAPARTDRVPLDLAFVLDASGSMAGEKLEAVKSALCRVVERMSPTDRLTLVSFASDVQVHATMQQVKSETHAPLVDEIRCLHPRGNTHLSAGWMAGVAALQAGTPVDPATTGTRRRAAVVLSDGHANAGVIDPAQLNEMAADTLAKGVATSCIGVGVGYSTTQLVAIADGSGGRFHHANTPDEIVAVLVGELDEVTSVAAEQVILKLALPAGVAALGCGASLRRQGDTVSCAVGSLYGGVARTLVFALDFPAAMAGTRGTIAVRVTGVDTTTGSTVMESEAVAYAYSVGADDHLPHDVVAAVTRQWVLWLTAEAACLNDLGDLVRVRALVEETLPRLHAYARSAAGALMIVHDAERALWRAAERMDSRSRKEMYVASRKPTRGERELREW
jgi:Ca-activated chloride channel family protein